jgi:hypothetical protein
VLIHYLPITNNSKLLRQEIIQANRLNAKQRLPEKEENYITMKIQYRMTRTLNTENIKAFGF